MDTPTDSNTGPLSADQAVDAFASLLTPQETDKPEQEAQASTEQPAETTEQSEESTETVEQQEQTFKANINGQDVEVPLSKLIETYQKGEASMQRFEEAAHIRKAAEAKEQEARTETAKTQQERQAYAQNLQNLRVQAEVALNEFNQIDLLKLQAENPVEAQRLMILASQRQALLNEVNQRQHALAQAQQAENFKAYRDNLDNESKRLVEKIPDWKDPEKAKKGQAEIAKYMVESLDYKPDEILGQYDDRGNLTRPGVSDHRLIRMAHKAMLYDKLVDSANAQAKKVSNLPTKVVTPGTGDAPRADKRSSAYRELAKNGGRVSTREQAATLFGNFV